MKKLKIEYFGISFGNLFRLEKNNKAIKYRILRGIRDLSEHEVEKKIINQ